MADPLLNTLCSICHISAPKYTCPGCNTHTCSLDCNKKHKSWANCSGKRDPTAYMPPSKLKTPAGIDHDYNFLSAIERERERNQREIVDERKLFTQKELGHQLDDPYSFRKQWFGENVHFHPVSGDQPRQFGSDGEESDGGGGGGGDGEDGGAGEEARSRRRNIPAKASQLTQRVRQRLAAENVQVVQMPVGMTRQRENTTGWNRKARRINWCVEWIIYDGGDGEGQGLLKKHTRIRHHALETRPLYKALGDSMVWYKKGQKADDGDGAADNNDEEDIIEPAHAGRRKKVLIREVKDDTEQQRGAIMQDDGSAAWANTRTPYPTQSPLTGAWSSDAGATTTSWDADAEVEARRRHRFYLLRPLTVAGKPKELIPVSAAEDLGAALRGRTVLEYPTIYVLPPVSSDNPSKSSTVETTSSSLSTTASPLLPEGHILGSTERRANTRKQSAAAAKRKAGGGPGSKDDNISRQQPSHKRQAVSGGSGAGEAGGIPIRASERGVGGASSSQRGARGRGRGGGGGRGGRMLQGGSGRQQRQHGAGHQDAEEGEVNSDGDDVAAATKTARPRFPAARTRAAVVDRADTSSSDPDSSSDDEDEDDGGGRNGGFWRSSRPPNGDMMVDDDDGPHEEAGTASSPATAAPAPAQGMNGIKKKPGGGGGGGGAGGGMGLVDYGSDSDEDDGDGSDEDDDGDADVTTLKPENPELVAGAIQEIVGLLS